MFYAVFHLLSPISAEKLELLNDKGTQLLTHLNQTWPNVADGLLQYTKIDDAYSAIVAHLSRTSNVSECKSYLVYH